MSLYFINTSLPFYLLLSWLTFNSFYFLFLYQQNISNIINIIFLWARAASIIIKLQPNLKYHDKSKVNSESNGKSREIY